VIAALAGGTVVVEAGARSGTLATARHASDLSRPLMAVPGPVTSAVSACCHALLREQRAVCVTSAADVTARLLTTLP
jgi:DNA processing protein